VFTRSRSGWVETAKLTASDAQAGDRFGKSVAVSGSTVVVGASDSDDAGDASGSAYVFTRSRSGWVETAKLTASDAEAFEQFGWSVAVSQETVVAGSLDSDGDLLGSVYVFTRGRQGWIETQKLTASDAAWGDLFGWSVAVSGDTMVVGARGYDDRLGSAYLFTRSPFGWVETAKLTPSDESPSEYFGDEFGYSVGVSDDAVVVGAPRNSEAGDESGAAYLFTRFPFGWIETAKLTASDAAALDRFGSSIGFSGGRVVVGAPRNEDGAGAYVFTETRRGWEETNLLMPADGAADALGLAVDVSGETIVVGAPSDDGNGYLSGSAYVFMP
jgi:hypothetical protein